MAGKNNNHKFLKKVVMLIIGIMFTMGGYFAKAQFDTLKATDDSLRLDIKEARLERDTIKEKMGEMKLDLRELKVLMQLMLEKQGVPKTRVSKALDSLNGE